MKLHHYILILGTIALVVTGCSTPRQMHAATALQELLNDGAISPEQFQMLMDAMNPSTWVSDAVDIVTSSLFGGGIGYMATNARRNSLRKRRGEPVGLSSSQA